MYHLLGSPRISLDLLGSPWISWDLLGSPGISWDLQDQVMLTSDCQRKDEWLCPVIHQHNALSVLSTEAVSSFLILSPIVPKCSHSTQISTTEK